LTGSALSIQLSAFSKSVPRGASIVLSAEC
jgi:hypothetical protein